MDEETRETISNLTTRVEYLKGALKALVDSIYKSGEQYNVFYYACVHDQRLHGVLPK
jgi:hypothetical protein